jgi:valyl-tRNA synthetase
MASRNTELSKTYDPAPLESKWYQWWIDQNLFDAKVDYTKKAFSIVLPPPNVTGALHMGHAYDHTFQDILARYKRACGYSVLWQPGTDHAGIATQNVVERRLMKEGVSRREMGRDAFVKRTWQWKEEYRSRIVTQMKSLGDSCDWKRERFTMDEGLSRAVRTVFCRLYEKGLIYKGKYIVNWCPHCHTALSDIEVEHSEEKGHMYYVRYYFKDSSDYILIATTRPETIPADVAVAVHPSDETHMAQVGREVIVPMTGGRLVNGRMSGGRAVPIIADRMVDPAFGTGYVKITPAHDPNDFQVGRTHHLEPIQIIDEDGRMFNLPGPAKVLEGLNVAEARAKSEEILKADGVLEKVEEMPHQVGHCYRCGTTVEPYLSEQWFVKVAPLAKRGVEASRAGKIHWVPSQWDKTYYQWMDGVRDWCISRQLWWGHRIPAWTCQDCGNLIVAETDPDHCPKCGSKNLKQDEDVLDTWFSSALWPFSTLGWPDKTEELKYFYPTSVLVTGFDIIFFWVSRMIMMGLEFMDDVPFHDVYIHALVRDEKGQKMSKSKGNGIDPIDMIKLYGADALRFTVAALTVQGRDILLGPSKIENYKHFINKIWNASRFALMNLGNDDCTGLPDPRHMRLHDRWILERLRRLDENVTKDLDSYFFGEAAREIYQFMWGDFCDWYIEMSKPALYGDEGTERQDATKRTLLCVFKDALRLMHPFIPFVTEELWHAFDFGQKPMELSGWPDPQSLGCDSESVAPMDELQEFIRSIRNLRAEAGLPPSQNVKRIVLRGIDSAFEPVLEANRDLISLCAKVNSIEVIPAGADKPHLALSSIVKAGQVFLPVGDLLDPQAEVERLKKELKQVEANLARSEKKLSSKNFVERAPEEVVETEKARAAESKSRRTRILENIKSLTED